MVSKTTWLGFIAICLFLPNGNLANAIDYNCTNDRNCEFIIPPYRLKTETNVRNAGINVEVWFDESGDQQKIYKGPAIALPKFLSNYSDETKNEFKDDIEYQYRVEETEVEILGWFTETHQTTWHRFTILGEQVLIGRSFPDKDRKLLVCIPAVIVTDGCLLVARGF